MAWRAPSEPGDSDPSVADAKRVLKRYAYGRSLDDGPVYTLEFGVALLQYKVNRNAQIMKGQVTGKPGMALDGKLDWAVKKNMEIKPYEKKASRPVIFTIQGHMGGMFDGPAYFTARDLEMRELVDVQPVWYDNTRKPFNNNDGVVKTDALIRNPAELPGGVPFLVLAHSQGSIVFCDWWENVAKPNLGKEPYRRFAGGINFGNPRRPRDTVAPWVLDPPKQGTEGLDPDCLDEPIPGVAEVSRDGDLYTNKRTPVDGGAEWTQAVYLAVARGKFFGRSTLAEEISELATRFGIMEVWGAFQAITIGVKGVAQLREHGEFDLRPCIKHCEIRLGLE